MNHLLISSCSSFGMLMPNRAIDAENYRWGFNDKENDNDVKGTGNQQDYGMRIYDARIGRWFSVDPITAKFPFYTPFQFAGNKPIVSIDLDGLENIYYGAGLEPGNSAMLVVHNNVEINQLLDKKFQNTDPNKGDVNIGWDMLIVNGPVPGSLGFTEPILKQDLKNAKGLKKYEDIVNDILSNPEKKGLIVVIVDDVKESDDDASEGKWQGAGEKSFVLTHEKRAHALPIAFGKSRPQTVEHGEYNEGFGASVLSPVPEVLRKYYPNSPAGRDLKANDDEATEYSNSGRQFHKIDKIEPKGINYIDVNSNQK